MGAIKVLPQMVVEHHHPPEYRYKFYMGHTNFQINEAIQGIVLNAEGVETLDIFSPYRLRVGVGKLFSPVLVLNEINAEIRRYLDGEMES